MKVGQNTKLVAGLGLEENEGGCPVSGRPELLLNNY